MGDYDTDFYRWTQTQAAALRAKDFATLDLKNLAESPSLHDYLSRQMTAAYRYARDDAADETGLPLASFPDACPWAPEQVLDADFWPEVGAKGDAS